MKVVAKSVAPPTPEYGPATIEITFKDAQSLYLALGINEPKSGGTKVTLWGLRSDNPVLYTFLDALDDAFNRKHRP